jgi:hypothetical protein
MIDTWIWVVGAIVVGLLSGVVGAALVRLAFVKGREGRQEIVDAARATSILVFLFFAVIGVVVAVGVSSPDTLRPIPRDLLRYSPHVLAAGMILIAGRAIGYAVAGYVRSALSRSTPRVRAQATETVRFVITAAAAVLALRQLGIDTTILNILIGAMLFGLAAGFALLVGFGGRELSQELAYGRYLGRILHPGDDLRVAGHEGIVVALHPASVELRTDDGTSVHLANSQVFRSVPHVAPGSVRAGS